MTIHEQKTIDEDSLLVRKLLEDEKPVAIFENGRLSSTMHFEGRYMDSFDRWKNDQFMVFLYEGTLKVIYNSDGHFEHITKKDSFTRIGYELMDQNRSPLQNFGVFEVGTLDIDKAIEISLTKLFEENNLESENNHDKCNLDLEGDVKELKTLFDRKYYCELPNIRKIPQKLKDKLQYKSEVYEQGEPRNYEPII